MLQLLLHTILEEGRQVGIGTEEILFEGIEESGDSEEAFLGVAGLLCHQPEGRMCLEQGQYLSILDFAQTGTTEFALGCLTE